MILKITVQESPKGPIVRSHYGDRLDARYRPARSPKELSDFVQQILTEWILYIEEQEDTKP